MTIGNGIVIHAVWIIFLLESAAGQEGFLGLPRGTCGGGAGSVMEEVQGNCGNSLKGQLMKLGGGWSGSGD